MQHGTASFALGFILEHVRQHKLIKIFQTHEGNKKGKAFSSSILLTSLSAVAACSLEVSHIITELPLYHSRCRGEKLPG